MCAAKPTKGGGGTQPPTQHGNCIIRPHRLRVRPSPDYEWFEKRMKEMGLTRTAVAAAFGYPPNRTNYLWRMLAETGKEAARWVRPDEIAVWAWILRTPYVHVVRRFGFTAPMRTIPVVGVVRSDGRISEILDPDHPNKAEAPYDATEQTEALYVETLFSELGVWNGSFIYYEPSKTVHGQAMNRLCVLELGDQYARVVGALTAGRRVDEYQVQMIGQSEPVTTRDLISASVVRWQSL